MYIERDIYFRTVIDVNARVSAFLFFIHFYSVPVARSCPCVHVDQTYFVHYDIYNM